MTVMIVLDRHLLEEDLKSRVKSLLDLLLYDPSKLWGSKFDSLFRYVGADSPVLEVLSYSLIKRGDLLGAYRVYRAIESPSKDLTRCMCVKEAHQYNRVIYPMTVPPEDWSSGSPILFDGDYEEWYAGRVEFIIQGEVTLRVKEVRDGNTRYGTLIVGEDKFPRLPRSGDFVEAVKVNGIWDLQYHPTGGKLYTPSLFQ